MRLRRVKGQTRKVHNRTYILWKLSTKKAILEELSHLVPSTQVSWHPPVSSSGLCPLVTFTSFIPSSKIDGRGHIGEETVDEGWSHNLLMIGKGFGH